MKKFILVTFISVFLLILPSCGTNTGENITTPSLLKGAKLQAFINQNEPEIGSQISDISLKVLKTIDSQSSYGLDNTVFSGYSLIYALGMLLSVERNNHYFYHNLQKFLETNLNDVQYSQLLSEINKLTLNDLGQNNTFENDNSYWLLRDDQLTQEQRFEVLKSLYGAHEFLWSQINELVNKLNAYILKKTHNFLNPNLDPTMFNGLTYAVLLNVLYFHGLWTVPLSESPDTFYNLSGTLTKVNFVGMEGEGYYPYVKTNNYLALGVGYNNSKLEMDFIMPTSENLTKFISSLTTQQLNLITSNLDKVRNEMSTNELIGSGSIEFPEFDVKSNIGLYNVLEQLGVNLDDSDVTAVYQQARIKVDQYGTTAAAATEASIGSSLEPPINPVVINHPFMFLIRDRATNTIYFLGQVASLS